MRLGFGEILVVLVLALLFFGPSKLPQLGASLGEAIKGFKKGVSSLDEEKQPEKLAASATQSATHSATQSATTPTA
ncbi:MAG: twin-arginine translocase TatA/TatE family subunit [Myxococcales bacterium]